VERCQECGFDGGEWTDDGAIDVLGRMPDRWAGAIDGLDPGSLGRRPIADMWSIAEYTDHVREVVFGMRYLLDVALSTPGTDVGDPPEPRFDAQPRVLDVPRALRGFRREVGRLCAGLQGTPADTWDAWVTLDGDRVDLHWIARHAVHDVTHHLRDIARLRTALG
jgi:hypothetical protein